MFNVNGQDFYTTPEIAKMAGLTRVRIWQLIHEGVLPAPFLAGRTYLIPANVAMAFVSGRMVKSRGPRPGRLARN